MKYGPEDFGYTFVQSDDDGDDVEQQKEDEGGAPAITASDSKVETTATDAAASGDSKRDDDNSKSSSKAAAPASSTSQRSDDAVRKSTKAGDSSDKPYVYTPSKQSGRGGKGGLPDDDDAKSGNKEAAMLAVFSGCGTCCCCVSAALIIAGGTMLAYENYTIDDNDNLALAGVIIIVVAVAAFMLGCCACCFGCVAACGGGVGGSASGRGGHDERDIKVEFRRLNGRYEKAEDALNQVHLNVIGGMKEVKEAQKKEEKKQKNEEKAKKDELEARVKKDLEAGLTPRNMRRNYRPTAFLVRFEGDTMVSSMELLRKQVSIIVSCGRPGLDTAVFVVTSPGGAVSNYGLAASQLVRIRKAGIHLVVCVDTIAASGGYMMASVGDIIYAAPFAIIGSVGVVTQIPNFQRFLNKHDIDAYLITAGKYKRTIDLIGDVTEEGKQKMQEDLDDIHRAFKDHVALARPRLKDSIEEVATGEHWLGVQAKELGLVDSISTSDEYLESICEENEIIEIIEKKQKPKWPSVYGLASAARGFVDKISAQQHPTPPPMALA